MSKRRQFYDFFPLYFFLEILKIHDNLTDDFLREINSVILTDFLLIYIYVRTTNFSRFFRKFFREILTVHNNLTDDFS